MADPALLDSYQIERIPVADAVLRLAGNLTMMLTLTNPMSRELRDHLMPILNGLGAVRHEIAVEDAQLSITYGASPIVSEYHHERFGHLKFAGGPRAGDRAPDAGPLAGGASPVRLYELLRGTHHTLVLFGGPEPKAATLQQLSSIARALSGQPEDVMRVHIVVDGEKVPEELAGEFSVLLDTAGAVHHRYQADGPTLYLVRPDGYIGFRSRPADHAALLTYLARIQREAAGSA